MYLIPCNICGAVCAVRYLNIFIEKLEDIKEKTKSHNSNVRQYNGRRKGTILMSGNTMDEGKVQF